MACIVTRPWVRCEQVATSHPSCASWRRMPCMPGTKLLETVTLPDGNEMSLFRWDKHIAIHVGKRPLMSSHEHGSEDALGRLVGERLAHVVGPRALIGGLGLGFTLRAALDTLPANAKLVVAELLADVVRWNRGVHGKYSKRPLADRRVKVIVGDVSDVIAKSANHYDAIVLDVDNGPDALTRRSNARLYKRAGLQRMRRALRAGGFLAVWSAFPSRRFTTWLREVGFAVDLLRPAPTTEGGPRYYIWVATK